MKVLLWPPSLKMNTGILTSAKLYGENVRENLDMPISHAVAATKRWLNKHPRNKLISGLYKRL